MGRTKQTTLRAALVLLIAILAAGCALTPPGVTPTNPREMIFTINFNGPINDNYYYYIPIDTNEDTLGPVPIFPGDSPTLEGWVTGAATHYVEYHAGQYIVYRITFLQPFASEPIGNPLRYYIPQSGSRILSFTIDLDQIDATGEAVDVNIIAVDTPYQNIRNLDALGVLGTQFLNIDITSNRTFMNIESISPETGGDVLDQNGIIQPLGEFTNPLDITSWAITINL